MEDEFQTQNIPPLTVGADPDKEMGPLSLTMQDIFLFGLHFSGNDPWILRGNISVSMSEYNLMQIQDLVILNYG